MRAFGLAVVAATMFGATAVAADGRFERSLKMLAPEERLEQLCDYTAMTRIRTEAKQYRPDRAVANAMAEPKASGDTLEVTGGAFRSRKKWYALSYRCTATPDRMSVVAFHFTIGERNPRSEVVDLTACGTDERTLVMLHNHLGPERHAIVEIRHIIIDQPEAA